MANASKGDVITLQMTEKEAKTLVLVIGGVGGPPEGYRGDIDNIGEALASIGYEDFDSECHKGDFIFLK